MVSQLFGWMSYYVSSQPPELKAVSESSSNPSLSHDDEAGGYTSNVDSESKPCAIDHSCAVIPTTDLSEKNQSVQTDVSSDNPAIGEKLDRNDCGENFCSDHEHIESSTSLLPGIESTLPLTVENIEKLNVLTDYDQVVNFEGRRTISTQTIKSTKKLRSSKKVPHALPEFKPCAIDHSCAVIPTTDISEKNQSVQTDVSVSPQNLQDEPVCSVVAQTQRRDAVLAKEDYEELKEKIRNSENVYGTLFVVGCNGSVPPHLKGSIKPRFILRKRPEPNGLKEARTSTRPRQELDPARHSISFFLPDSDNSMVVVFQRDESTDMFQIGRHERHPVDFSVTDVRPVDRARKGVSRFACRIVVEREGRRLARVYASAFDTCNTIFLGERGFTMKQGDKADGFTTNGVLLMHPDGDQPGTWREVSVCGNIYPLRSPKYEDARRPRIHDETNVLRDGSLIDLCGVTLLWRTPEGLRRTRSWDYLSRLQAAIHAEVPECQKLDELCRQERRLKTRNQEVRRPKNCIQDADGPKNCWQGPPGTKKAYVFISCGHVVGLTLPRPPESVWPCPMCRGVSYLVELKIGLERGFYLDREFPGYAFRPCGHAASLQTVKYWSQVKIPNHRNVQDSQCPFCGERLNHIKQFVQLTLPDLPRDAEIEPVFEKK